MFKNLQSGAQPAAAGAVGDSKLRVDVSGVPFTPSCFLPTCPNRDETFHSKKTSKDFRWHVSVCQPINASILRRKIPPTVGSLVDTTHTHNSYSSLTNLAGTSSVQSYSVELALSLSLSLSLSPSSSSSSSAYTTQTHARTRMTISSLVYFSVSNFLTRLST